MLARLSRSPGYQQITEMPRFDVLKHACTRVADVPRSFGCNEQTIYCLQTRFRKPGSKNYKPPSGRPWITTPLEVRAIVTST